MDKTLPQPDRTRSSWEAGPGGTEDAGCAGPGPSPWGGSSPSAGSVQLGRPLPTGAQPPTANTPTRSAHTPRPEGALSPHAALGLINHNTHKEILKPRDARGDRETVRTTPKQPPSSMLTLPNPETGSRRSPGNTSGSYQISNFHWPVLLGIVSILL